MTTKELIVAEIDKLSGAELQELYALIREFTQMKRQSKPQSLMSRLKRIAIDGPADFAANHDAYVTGENRARPNSD
jgi:hypothetical protein